MTPRALDASLWLPLPLEQVFGFFSDAGNLDAITPPWVGFRILTPKPIAMHVGASIDYQIRVHHLPVKWRTVITQWEPPHRFVDEQAKGPYRQWIHEHRFEAADGGTLVHDHVDYAVPGWWLEPLLHRYFVGPDLRAIFTHRQARIREILAPGSSAAGDRLELSRRGLKASDR